MAGKGYWDSSYNLPWCRTEVPLCHQATALLPHLEVSVGTQMKPAQFLNQGAKERFNGSCLLLFPKYFFREMDPAGDLIDFRTTNNYDGLSSRA